MRITREDIDSLAAKLHALSGEEKLALRLAVAAGHDGEVAGFGQRLERDDVAFHFDKIEWVWKAPAGLEALNRSDGQSLLDYDWIA